MGSNLRIVCNHRRLEIATRSGFWILHHFQKALKIAALTTLPLFLVGCSASVKSVEDSCEVRIYQQQVLLAFSNNARILKSGGVPSVAGNRSLLQQYLVDDLWLIQDYVRFDEFLPIPKPKTTDFENIDANTTFLIVGTEEPSTYKFGGNKYFEGDYSELGLDETCPIFIGRRNDNFALATVRTLGGSETRERCDIHATLTFFGISKEELENYSDYVEVDIFGPSYDRYSIRTYLESKKRCGGDDFKNLRVAAEEGDAEAQYNLGGAYLSSEGGVVAMDDVEALKWIMLAANQGYAEAQALLGDMYGPGKREDDKEAAKWYHLAAKQGIKYAQYNLGQMYAEGKGVDKDYIQSYLWLSISETDQDRHIKILKKSLARSMTDDQIAQAESLAAKCVESNYQDCD